MLGQDVALAAANALHEVGFHDGALVGRRRGGEGHLQGGDQEFALAEGGGGEADLIQETGVGADAARLNRDVEGGFLAEAEGGGGLAHAVGAEA